MRTSSVAVMEVSPSTFREIKRKLDAAGYMTGSSRLSLDGIELLEGDPTHEEAQYLTDVENAYRHGHAKGGVEPNVDKGWKAYDAQRNREWRGPN